MTSEPFDDALAAAEAIQGKPDVTPGAEDLGRQAGAPRPSAEVEIYEPVTTEGDRRAAKTFGRATVETVKEHIGGNYTSTAQDAAADFAEFMIELGRSTGKGLWIRGALSFAALGLVFVPAIVGAMSKLRGGESDDTSPGPQP